MTTTASAVRGVKLVTYFDTLGATNGGLRFFSCSQHDSARPYLRTYQRSNYDDMPGVVAETRPGDVVAETRPGDVVAFDLHTFHASFGGRDRLAWTIQYLAVPANEEEREKTLRWMADAFEQGVRGFDCDRYPTWRDWLANASGHPRRAPVIERLQTAGALSLQGAELGR